MHNSTLPPIPKPKCGILLEPESIISAPSGLTPAAAVSNLGLHNQLVGLRWITENIGHFGGNKDSVALNELRLIIDSMFC
ncbi:hypothetical protein TYRP_008565 [Tyrophagus putrescentiae]|nr:hypothetical protein TYRP_008565 [Tyrophagus putrescentiae]